MMRGKVGKGKSYLFKIYRLQGKNYAFIIVIQHTSPGIFGFQGSFPKIRMRFLQYDSTKTVQIAEKARTFAFMLHF